MNQFSDVPPSTLTETLAPQPESGWRYPRRGNSLSEVFATIKVPPANASFWRKLMAFWGPGLMVAVGYMDPGNWATDLAGGARYGYTLLSVVLISNLFAILLQHLAAKLGIVSGRDLDRKSTRLNSSHQHRSRMPSSA